MQPRFGRSQQLVSGDNDFATVVSFCPGVNAGVIVYGRTTHFTSNSYLSDLEAILNRCLKEIAKALVTS